MDIQVRLAFDEMASVRLLNWLAKENARIFRGYDRAAARKGRRSLPGLYESGVIYRREKVEIWSDYLNLLMQGHEDCDALSAARTGELLARGWKALRPRDPNDPVRYPGDGGYEQARRLRLESIEAQCFITTRTKPGQGGMYHCLTRYWIGDTEYRDDPSARLGMIDGEDAILSRAAMLRSKGIDAPPTSPSNDEDEAAGRPRRSPSRSHRSRPGFWNDDGIWIPRGSLIAAGRTP